MERYEDMMMANFEVVWRTVLRTVKTFAESNPQVC